MDTELYERDNERIDDTVESNEDKKYELTDETLEWGGHILHRIRALKDFDHIKNGQFGGFIESEDNLSQEGNCWVYGTKIPCFRNGDGVPHYDDGVVYGNARVSGNAKVGPNAMVYGNAVVSGNTYLCECLGIFCRPSFFPFNVNSISSQLL